MHACMHARHAHGAKNSAPYAQKKCMLVISISDLGLALQRNMKVLLTLLLAHLVSSAYCSANCYDHQLANYESQFEPAQCNQQCKVTPYFSPDHSLDTYLDLIQSATDSVDLYTPGKA